MQLPVYQLDAFTDRPFHGNPATVIPLAGWLRDETLQAIATELAVSETAFVAPSGPDYHIRWFTPTVEVDLCGHATLAAASVLFDSLPESAQSLTFQSLSGPLLVTRKKGRFSLYFPSRPPKEADPPAGLFDALGCPPAPILRSIRDVLVVLPDERAVLAIHPDFCALAATDAWAVIVTAPGEQVDFVSRFFAPRQGINEDAATGSTQCTLGPYWAERLGRNKLKAKQLSAREGEMEVEVDGKSVLISGSCVRIMAGTLTI